VRKTIIKKTLGRSSKEPQINEDLKWSEWGCELDSTNSAEDPVTTNCEYDSGHSIFMKGVRSSSLDVTPPSSKTLFHAALYFCVLPAEKFWEIHQYTKESTSDGLNSAYVLLPTVSLSHCSSYIKCLCGMK
jgi:hypothetical protein